MPYFIQTFDKENSHELRAVTRQDHLDYLEGNSKPILACGAKLNEADGQATGGVYIVDVETREEAEEFIDNDPFSRVGLFDKVQIESWRKAFLDGKSFV